MKRLWITILIATSLAFMVGCTHNQMEQDDLFGPKDSAVMGESTPEPTVVTVEIPEELPPPVKGENEAILYKDPSQITFSYFDLISMENKTETYLIEGEATPSSGLDAVNQVMFGKDLIKVSSIEYSDGNLFFDFDSSMRELNIGSQEADVLDAIANAYLNNVEGIQYIYFTIEGETYATKNIELQKDQPYILLS